MFLALHLTCEIGDGQNLQREWWRTLTESITRMVNQNIIEKGKGVVAQSHHQERKEAVVQNRLEKRNAHTINYVVD